MPGWVFGIIVGVIIIVVVLILVCVATKKCKKKFKCARIVKCCKKNAGANAQCCGQNIHSSDSDK